MSDSIPGDRSALKFMTRLWSNSTTYGSKLRAAASAFRAANGFDGADTAPTYPRICCAALCFAAKKNVDNSTIQRGMNLQKRCSLSLEAEI
jgi:hypothetical protein